jgi:hypothetical protein
MIIDLIKSSMEPIDQRVPRVETKQIGSNNV